MKSGGRSAQPKAIAVVCTVTCVTRKQVATLEERIFGGVQEILYCVP